ncbi:hypothetical protein ACFS5L_15890 [Streptomyces phyllanthi]|uniref:Uncharacterized protein n=1 Tax=Streptomyces phyllanthi TaxID=1803180 RepID=A0A5N8VY97_9ACTN|nr:hypothetical protein [Streptomyces phyllanthi]MPY38905.1 hypothetical protein [Streptomyces phyllanthi]
MFRRLSSGHKIFLLAIAKLVQVVTERCDAPRRYVGPLIAGPVAPTPTLGGAMAVLLYYPLVNPPQEILHQSLLYWDGIASVVPKAPEVYEAVLAPELAELKDRQLYTPVALWDEALEPFEAPRHNPVFVRASSASMVLCEELRRMADRPRPPRVCDPPDSFLYVSKVSAWLLDELLSLGLAAPYPRELWAVAVPKEVQTLIVGVLAREVVGELGMAYDRAFVPYTDSADAHRWSLQSPYNSRALAWEMELGRLLPVPAPGTTTAQVLQFRERYADERLRLMRAVHRLLGELRRDYEHPADVFAQLRVELAQAVEDYRAAARGSRLAWVHRSVMVAIALAAAAGGTLLQPDLGWLLGTVGGYTLNVATREIRPLTKARKGHDFSYLHRVQNNLS